MLIDYIKGTIGITLKKRKIKISRYRFSRSTSFIDNNDGIKVESVDPEHYVHSAVNKMIFQTNTTKAL
jgi:hypothetical protein